MTFFLEVHLHCLFVCLYVMNVCLLHELTLDSICHSCDVVATICIKMILFYISVEKVSPLIWKYFFPSRTFKEGFSRYWKQIAIKGNKGSFWQKRQRKYIFKKCAQLFLQQIYLKKIYLKKICNKKIFQNISSKIFKTYIFKKCAHS